MFEEVSSKIVKLVKELQLNMNERDGEEMIGWREEDNSCLAQSVCNCKSFK
jgi:hypothetical protein